MGCRPREGCGLHQQKDTNPYRHFDAILLIRALSIAQAPSEKQDFCEKATVFVLLFWIARRITPFFRGVFCPSKRGVIRNKKILLRKS